MSVSGCRWVGVTVGEGHPPPPAPDEDDLLQQPGGCQWVGVTVGGISGWVVSMSGCHCGWGSYPRQR